MCGQAMKAYSDLPLVYSCSGASTAAQMANHIAVKLDRLREAEMSCIAGVGGDVKPLVRTARSGRPIVALDGCPLQCAAKILARQGLAADKHYELSKMGVKKTYHEDFDPVEAGRLLEEIRADIASTIGARSSSPDSPEPAAAAREEAKPLRPGLRPESVGR